MEQNHENLTYWGKVFTEHRANLQNLALKNLNPILSRRLSAEDLVQETLASACRRIEYFEKNPEVPVYFKLRTLLMQTITDYERRHLQNRKRDAYKELYVANTPSAGGISWDMFAAGMTSPLTKIARAERAELLHKALEALSENDRQILTLRHFDELSNLECARILKVDPKAASIRYVRALEHLQKKLIEFSEFKP